MGSSSTPPITVTKPTPKPSFSQRARLYWTVHKKLLIGVIVGLVVVILAVILYFMFIDKNVDRTENPDQYPIPIPSDIPMDEDGDLSHQSQAKYILQCSGYYFTGNASNLYSKYFTSVIEPVQFHWNPDKSLMDVKDGNYLAFDTTKSNFFMLNSSNVILDANGNVLKVTKSNYSLVYFYVLNGAGLGRLFYYTPQSSLQMIGLTPPQNTQPFKITTSPPPTSLPILVKPVGGAISASLQGMINTDTFQIMEVNEGSVNNAYLFETFSYLYDTMSTVQSILPSGYYIRINDVLQSVASAPDSPTCQLEVTNNGVMFLFGVGQTSYVLCIPQPQYLIMSEGTLMVMDDVGAVLWHSGSVLANGKFVCGPRASGSYNDFFIVEVEASELYTNMVWSAKNPVAQTNPVFFADINESCPNV